MIIPPQYDAGGSFAPNGPAIAPGRDHKLKAIDKSGNVVVSPDAQGRTRILRRGSGLAIIWSKRPE